ncbi:hypothetical protein C9374_006374 [Naegleria lovaniensis]|uniref:Chloride channel protein n=1 Tax=Naegleria lovaniensis TaxID=51637 RepID=A0AA88GJP1_NAELO|nr:uncharacterized protein C9374_006374 [Naegleria lovaniensis]KAG2381385.1 hypothetical protein C9374_006374 [Naegleria lovaniensis]
MKKFHPPSTTIQSTYIVPPPGMNTPHSSSSNSGGGANRSGSSHLNNNNTPPHSSPITAANTTTSFKRSSSSEAQTPQDHFSDVHVLDEDEVELRSVDGSSSSHLQQHQSRSRHHHHYSSHEDDYTPTTPAILEDFQNDDFIPSSHHHPIHTMTSTTTSDTFATTNHHPNSSSSFHTKRRNNNNNSFNISSSTSFEQINTLNMLKIIESAHNFENKLNELKQQQLDKQHQQHFIRSKLLTLHGFKTAFKKYTNFNVQKYVWTYLFVLGVVGGLVVFLQDLLISYIFLGREELINHFSGMENESAKFTVQLLMWVLYTLLFVVCALFITAWVAPTAEGSGIPPVKAILTGVDSLKDPISFKTLIVKVLCLPMVLGVGMMVGKVGPTIHIGAALAENLLQLGIFSGIRNSKTLRAQMLACGCALGIGANFGAPGGGVLFALEAIGTYYSVRTYIKSFFVAVLAALTARLLHSAVSNQFTFLPSAWNINFTLPAYTIPDLFSFIFLGVYWD